MRVICFSGIISADTMLSHHPFVSLPILALVHMISECTKTAPRRFLVLVRLHVLQAQTDVSQDTFRFSLR
jgi:hypothetical protein